MFFLVSVGFLVLKIKTKPQKLILICFVDVFIHPYEYFHTTLNDFGFDACRVLEKVNFESKFDKLPEFQPEKAIQSTVPQSPSMLLAGLRRKQYDALESPATPLKFASPGLPTNRLVYVICVPEMCG